MSRPCFLVVDREFPGSISTRKLVLETAKLNVITAYDADEGVDMLRRFPNVDGIVVSSPVGMAAGCRSLVERLRAINPKMPIVVTSMNGEADCGEVTHHLPSFDPGQLLDVLKSFFPQAVDEILQDEVEMEKAMKKFSAE